MAAARLQRLVARKSLQACKTTEARPNMFYWYKELCLFLFIAILFFLAAKIWILEPLLSFDDF
jgi:hypothetical protein